MEGLIVFILVVGVIVSLFTAFKVQREIRKVTNNFVALLVSILAFFFTLALTLALTAYLQNTTMRRTYPYGGLEDSIKVEQMMRDSINKLDSINTKK